jgi:redox-sensitive bicupin YhaK (pirin superfamily)
MSIDTEHEERGIYVVEGVVECEDRTCHEGTLVVFRPGVTVTIRSVEPARVMLLGGARLAGERHVWWNFVSSSEERIERAKDDWRNGRFPKVAGDEVEFTPLPER